MTDGIGHRWKQASIWYAARPKREKLILGAAALAVVWAVMDALWLSPATRMLQTESTLLRQKESELVQLESQRIVLTEALRAREAEQKRELEAARADLAGTASRLAEFEKALVPASQMADFLRSLLPGAGVEIAALKTLPPVALIVRAPPADGAAKSAGQAKSAQAPAANIYRHGMEITLTGNYDALAAYLTRIEQSPRKVLWGTMELKVLKHPRNELTLVLYTLSLDLAWMVV